MASQRLPATVMARARKKLRVPDALRPSNQKEGQGVRPERVCGSRTCLPYKEKHFAPGSWVLMICLLLLSPESFEMVCELRTTTLLLLLCRKPESGYPGWSGEQQRPQGLFLGACPRPGLLTPFTVYAAHPPGRGHCSWTAAGSWGCWDPAPQLSLPLAPHWDQPPGG